MHELAGKIQDSELEVMRVLWEARDAMQLSEIRPMRFWTKYLLAVRKNWWPRWCRAGNWMKRT